MPIHKHHGKRHVEITSTTGGDGEMGHEKEHIGGYGGEDIGLAADGQIKKAHRHHRKVRGGNLTSTKI